MAARLRAAGVGEVHEVRNAPDRVSLSALPVDVQGRPVFGIGTEQEMPQKRFEGQAAGGWSDTDGVEAVTPPVESASVGFAPVGLPAAGLGVIAGPSGAGLSTAAVTCAAAYARWAAASGAPTHCVLLTFVKDGLRRAPMRARAASPRAAQGVMWHRIACGEDEVAALARELTLRLGEKPPRLAGPATERTVVVVERPTEAEGTAALTELVALAKVARRADALVLFEFEQGTGAGVWDLFSALKQPTWGLALQPDEGESQSPFRERLGRVKRTNFPPGRGFAIEGGRVTPIHVAAV